MEVHAHAHTERKKWTHYFWEFLMLFLAVTLGFFVENQREHYVEHLRAKEYAISLIEDLTADTTELLDVIHEDEILLSCFDSINSIVHKGIKDNTVPGGFYYYCSIGTFSPTVVWYDATLTQITQSGSLRYFKNVELIKKLSSYYSGIAFISNMNNTDRGYRDESIKLRSKILNNFFNTRYSAYTFSSWQQVPDSVLKIRLPVQINNQALLNELANSFEARRRVLNLLLTRDYPDALNSARELVKMLKNEYHLK